MNINVNQVFYYQFISRFYQVFSYVDMFSYSGHRGSNLHPRSPLFQGFSCSVTVMYILMAFHLYIADDPTNDGNSHGAINQREIHLCPYHTAVLPELLKRKEGSPNQLKGNSADLRTTNHNDISVYRQKLHNNWWLRFLLLYVDFIYSFNISFVRDSNSHIAAGNPHEWPM